LCAIHYHVISSNIDTACIAFAQGVDLPANNPIKKTFEEICPILDCLKVMMDEYKSTCDPEVFASMLE
jgi:hypothetical protein